MCFSSARGSLRSGVLEHLALCCDSIQADGCSGLALDTRISALSLSPCAGCILDAQQHYSPNTLDASPIASLMLGRWMLTEVGRRELSDAFPATFRAAETPECSLATGELLAENEKHTHTESLAGLCVRICDRISISRCL